MILRGISRLVRGVFRGVKKAVGWLLGVPKEQDPKALEVQREGSDQHLPVVYGERIVGGVLVHQFSTDIAINVPIFGSISRKNAFLHQIVAFSHGEIESFEQFYFNDTPASEFAGKYQVYTSTGAEGANAIPQAVANIPNWFNDMRGRNVAYAYFVFYQDKNQENWRGAPQIKARIKGRKVYDPRTDTVAYSTNNAICTLDYLTNEIYGRGLPLSRIDVQAFIDAANFCDEGTSSTITITECENDEDPTAPPICTTRTETITPPRYRMAAVINTAETLFNNYRELLQSFRAFPRRPNGLVSLKVETNEDSVMSFDESELRGEINFARAGQKDRFNRFITRFPNRLDRFERDEYLYPPVDDPLYEQWLAEDNGKELIGELELNTIGEKSMAAQTSEIAAKRSRVNGKLKVILPPRARLLEPGDVIDLTSPLYGWVEKTFRITSIQEQENNTFAVECDEHENAIYPWSGAEWSEQIGGSFIGDPTNPAAPDDLSLVRDLTYATHGVLSWSEVDNGFVAAYDVAVYENDTPEVIIFEQRTSGTSVSIPRLLAGEYTIEVRSVTRLGIRSETPSTLPVILFEQIPLPPGVIEYVPRNFEITVQPPEPLLGEQYEFDISVAGVAHTPEPQKRGRDATFVSLNPETEYTIWTRKNNALGVTDWVSENVSTLIDGTQVDPVIRVAPTIVQQRRDLSDLNYRFSLEQIDRLNSDIKLLGGAIDAFGQRDEFRRRIRTGERLIDAVVEIDPDTGTIINKAFIYTDTQFAQAAVLIDGVEGSVNILSQRVTFNEDEVVNLQSQINALPAEIELIASAVVAESIAALQPAHTFNFFGSAQGWVAVNGVLTEGSNEITVTWGDIENSNLDYDADDNGLIRIELERTAGTGWSGTVIIERDDNSTETFTGIIEEPPEIGSIVRNIDFRGLTEYSGTVNRVRLILGESTSDEFTIKSIVIGKADAALIELGGVTARVTEAEININALQGTITQKVDTTFYEENSVTFSNFGQTLDANEGYAEIVGTFQELDENGTITKANQAGIFIGSFEGTFEAYVQSVQQELDDLDEEVGFVFTDLSTRLDAQTGTIRNQAFQLFLNDQGISDALVAQLEASAVLGLYRLGQRDTNLSFASAVNQLFVDVSPEGALAQAIQGVEAVTVLNGQAIEATSTLLNEVVTNPFGVSSALAALNATVVGEEGLVSSFAQFESEFDSVTGELLARAFLGTDVNGRITGIDINDSGEEQSIVFIAPSVSIFNPLTETFDVEFDGVNGRLIVRGEIQADAGYFAGLVRGGSIAVGGTDAETAPFRVNELGDVFANSIELVQPIITNGSIVGASINIGSGNLVIDSDGNITQQGGFYQTAPSSSSAIRVLLDGRENQDYTFWSGVGAATDENALLAFKRDGTVVASESFKLQIGAGDTGGTISEYVETTVVNTGGSGTNLTHATKGGRIDVNGTLYMQTVQVDGDHREGVANCIISLQRNNASFVTRTIPMTVQFEPSLGMNGTTFFSLSGGIEGAVSGLDVDSSQNFRTTFALAFPLSVVLSTNPTVNLSTKTTEIVS